MAMKHATQCWLWRPLSLSGTHLNRFWQFLFALLDPLENLLRDSVQVRNGTPIFYVLSQDRGHYFPQWQRHSVLHHYLHVQIQALLVAITARVPAGPEGFSGGVPLLHLQGNIHVRFTCRIKGVGDTLKELIRCIQVSGLAIVFSEHFHSLSPSAVFPVSSWSSYRELYFSPFSKCLGSEQKMMCLVSFSSVLMSHSP